MRYVMLLFLIGMTLLWAKEKFFFADWRDQIKLNSEIFESEAHNAYVDIFVNKKAEAAYKTRASIYPVGAIVYKPLYRDTNKSELTLLVVMQKMPKGYDTNNGDWWYGVYDAAGKNGYYKGRIKSCIVCHAQVKETDYMFSNSVMDKIEKGKSIENVLPFY